MDCPKNKGEVMRGSAFNKACRKNPPKKGQITERLQTIPWGDLGVQMVQFLNDFMFFLFFVYFLLSWSNPGIPLKESLGILKKKLF